MHCMAESGDHYGQLNVRNLALMQSASRDILSASNLAHHSCRWLLQRSFIAAYLTCHEQEMSYVGTITHDKSFPVNSSLHRQLAASSEDTALAHVPGRVHGTAEWRCPRQSPASSQLCCTSIWTRTLKPLTVFFCHGKLTGLAGFDLLICWAAEAFSVKEGVCHAD